MVGIKGKSFTVAALAAAGVKRISLATSLYRAAIDRLLSAAKEVREHGTFGYIETSLRELPVGVVGAQFAMLWPVQLLPGEIGVRLDPLAIGVRQCRVAEYPPARLQAFLVTADPVGIDGVFLEQAVLVDPIFRDEGIVWTLDQEAALRQIEPLPVALL